MKNFSPHLIKLFSLDAAHSGWETDRWTFLGCCNCRCCWHCAIWGGRECGCCRMSAVALKLSKEKSLCSDGWYDIVCLIDTWIFNKVHCLSLTTPHCVYKPRSGCWMLWRMMRMRGRRRLLNYLNLLLLMLPM